MDPLQAFVDESLNYVELSVCGASASESEGHNHVKGALRKFGSDADNEIFGGKAQGERAWLWLILGTEVAPTLRHLVRFFCD